MSERKPRLAARRAAAAITDHYENNEEVPRVRFYKVIYKDGRAYVPKVEWWLRELYPRFDLGHMALMVVKPDTYVELGETLSTQEEDLRILQGATIGVLKMTEKNHYEAECGNWSKCSWYMENPMGKEFDFPGPRVTPESILCGIHERFNYGGDRAELIITLTEW